MVDYESLIGLKFGSLTVSQIIRQKHTLTQIVCFCECGFSVKKQASKIRSHLSLNCKNCYTYKAQKKHGAANQPEYQIWQGIKYRCKYMKPENKNYKYYIGRGITICDRWESFHLFIEDMGRRPSFSHSIDRIDNDKGYYKDNCRWATPKEQVLNRRTQKAYTRPSGLKYNISYTGWSISEKTGKRIYK